MSMEYFYRGSWRAVSAAKARLLRAKGYRVREAAGEKPVVKVAMPKDRREIVEGAHLVKVTERAPALPPPPWPTQPKTVEQPHGLRINPDAPSLGLTVTGTVTPRLTTLRGETVNVMPDDVRDLTDEELERLTAPDGGEG